MKAIHIRKICERPEWPPPTVPRSALSATNRREILKKTDGRCHVCGDRVAKRWHVDHVLPHQLGGDSRMANCRPICPECNGLRWSHAPKVTRLILRLGVYAKHEIRDGRKLGDQLVRLVLRRLARNKERRATAKILTT